MSSADAMAATFTVRNTNDSGVGSLRQAIINANLATTFDTIEFQSLLFDTPQTITLTTGKLSIANNGGISNVTVRRDWNMAKAWLHQQITY